MTTEEFALKQAEMSNMELIKLADKQVSELAKTGGRSHRMSVPPQITDTDIIFCELIKRFENINNLNKQQNESIIQSKISFNE